MMSGAVVELFVCGGCREVVCAETKNLLGDLEEGAVRPECPLCGGADLTIWVRPTTKVRVPAAVGTSRQKSWESPTSGSALMTKRLFPVTSYRPRTLLNVISGYRAPRPHDPQIASFSGGSGSIRISLRSRTIVQESSHASETTEVISSWRRAGCGGSKTRTAEPW
jgi:hypothetical protein